MTKQGLYESQKLGLWYMIVGLILFGAQNLFGLLIAYQYINPDFLFGLLNFNIGRILHINAMVVWLLLGFIGSIYWFLPIETGRETVGIKLGKLAFFILVAAVTVVVLVYLFVQIGPGTKFSLWFINEGREYIEAPRWADIGIVVVVLVFLYNVIATVIASKRLTGIMGVLIVDLVALAGLYLAGMFYTVNISVDQYFWWWVIHLWVEATWEVLIGAIMALALMYLLKTPRKIVEGWLYLEVFLVFGTGILGLGHHYFWIGTPEYWLGIGGFFSALEPLPLVAMIIHSIYDAGSTKLRTVNRPALFWVFAQAFGNFFGAGVWGFMQTLPQINMYSHGTQLAASHGHMAFFGAYVATNLAVAYIMIQKIRDPEEKYVFDSKLWKWSYVLMIIGLVGMVGALMVAGFAQTEIERAVGGSGWQAYIDAQLHPWMAEAMWWRLGFGFIFFIGYILLIIDLLTIGKNKEELEPLPEEGLSHA